MTNASKIAAMTFEDPNTDALMKKMLPGAITVGAEFAVDNSQGGEGQYGETTVYGFVKIATLAEGFRPSLLTFFQRLIPGVTGVVASGTYMFCAWNGMNTESQGTSALVDLSGVEGGYYGELVMDFPQEDAIFAVCLVVPTGAILTGRVELS